MWAITVTSRLRTTLFFAQFAKPILFASTESVPLAAVGFALLLLFIAFCTCLFAQTVLFCSFSLTLNLELSLLFAVECFALRVRLASSESTSHAIQFDLLRGG